MINFLIEKFIWQLIEVRYLLIEVRYLLILWLVLIPSLTIHPENGSLFPQWLKGIPAREQSPSYLMHKIGEYVITYPKINDNTMSLQSRQQNDIKTQLQLLHLTKLWNSNTTRKLLFWFFAQIKTIDSSVHLFLCCLVLYAQIKHCKMFIKCVTFFN